MLREDRSWKRDHGEYTSLDITWYTKQFHFLRRITCHIPLPESSLSLRSSEEKSEEEWYLKVNALSLIYHSSQRPWDKEEERKGGREWEAIASVMSGFTTK